MGIAASASSRGRENATQNAFRLKTLVTCHEANRWPGEAECASQIRHIGWRGAQAQRVEAKSGGDIIAQPNLIESVCRMIENKIKRDNRVAAAGVAAIERPGRRGGLTRANAAIRCGVDSKMPKMKTAYRRAQRHRGSRPPALPPRLDGRNAIKWRRLAASLSGPPLSAGRKLVAAASLAYCSRLSVNRECCVRHEH